jgi:hypothetical protein
VGRRRRVAECIRCRTGRQRPFAIDRIASGVDHTTKPTFRRPHGGSGRTHDGAASAAHTFKRPKWHQQHVRPRKSHDFADDVTAGAGLDHHAGTHRHGVDRSRGFDHETAHTDDAAIDLDPVKLRDLLRQSFHESVPRHGLVAALNSVFTRVVNHCVTV